MLGSTLLGSEMTSVVGFVNHPGLGRRFSSRQPYAVAVPTTAKEGMKRRKSGRQVELSSSTVPLEYPSSEDGLLSAELMETELGKIAVPHHDSTLAESALQHPSKTPGLWPCFDELDRRLISISLPVIANFAINPLIGAVDLFWVNRMGNALAVAGQAAANQVFNSAFWLASFLPSGEFVFQAVIFAANTRSDFGLKTVFTFYSSDGNACL